MPDDPTVQWVQATNFGIQIDEHVEAWHSGHVNDILELQDRSAIVVATESGGVWMIDGDNNSLPLSDTWENPDVKSLALGPDGPRHLFAGCTAAYDSAERRSYKVETGSSPVIMETDSAQLAPLLAWNPISAALPVGAGRVTRIVVIRNLRRIVVACATVRPGDTGGIFWATIPPTRFNAGDPLRPTYVWKQAKVVGVPDGGGFWEIAVAATSANLSRDNLEDRHTITLVAGGFGGGGLAVGQWNSSDDLVFTRPTVSFDDGSDATALVFDSCGTSSVSSCEFRPTVLYAACAWPDGRLNSLLRSEDGGWHWTFCAAQKASGAGPLDLINPLVGEFGNNWTNCISAHPMNPGAAALGWQAGPFLTIDGGTTWRLIDGSPHVHSDLHALQFVKDTPDSIGNLFVGSDGGVARINLDDFLNPPGQPFRSDYNRNLPTLQCYSTLVRQFYGTLDASAQFSGVVVAGLQDNGNVTCRLRPTVEPWRRVDDGDGGCNAFVAGYGYLHNIMGEAVKATAPLTSAVQTAIIPMTSPVPGDPAGLRALVCEAVKQPTHRNPAGQLLAAVAAPPGSNAVFGLFTATGDAPPYHWELIGTLPADQMVSALGSFHGERIFAGTGQGKMYAIDSATGSVIGQKVTLPQPSPSTQMQDGAFIRIVGFDETKMFATLVGATEVKITGVPILGTPAVQGYVLQLDGDTWNVTAGAGLPNEYLYGFVEISAPGTRIEHGLMATTDDAVYISRDDGQTWQRASSGLPRRAHCGDLRFVVDILGAAKIYLGTFGRSLWVASL
jgi:hypothetical protein